MPPSQPQQDSITIYEEEVQDRDLPHMLEEKSMLVLENEEQTNKLISLPLHKKENVENFEKNEEARVDALIGL